MEKEFLSGFPEFLGDLGDFVFGEGGLFGASPNITEKDRY